MDNLKSIIKNIVNIAIKEKYNIDKELNFNIRLSDKPENGDFNIPCFAFAKELKKNPKIIAEEIDTEIQNIELFKKYFEKTEVINGYINFYVNREKFITDSLSKIYKDEHNYCRASKRDESVVIDYSSPNIAKPFSIGHLRTTVIGHSLKKILQFAGYTVYGVNHLGDWGTSFGKLVVAYERWKDEVDFEKSPIKAMLELYVKFHKELENEPELEQLARDKFTLLEKGDKDIEKIWRYFVDSSLTEIKKTYKLLDIEFDYYTGESFYNNLLEDAVKKVEESGISKYSEGALIVDLQKYDMPPVLLKKKDGSTLYATRDLAAYFYRKKTFNPKKILYVVGSEQKLYWKQMFKLLELLGEKDIELQHIDFGLYNFKDSKMSTRKGNVIFLEDVLNEAISRAKEIIKEKNANLKNPDDVAYKVGISSVIFGDLINDRRKNVLFDWQRILNFDGENAPYIQYSYVKIASIFRKLSSEKNINNIKEYLDSSNIDISLLNSNDEFNLVKKLVELKDAINNAVKEYMPSYIAQKTLEIAKSFNKFYNNHSVLNEQNKDVMNARIYLCYCTKIVLEICAELIHIKLPQEM